MTKPTLVIMAAGMGSRYGGLKQIDPIDPQGHIIMDYSIYDAVQAGFGKVIFIIKKEKQIFVRASAIVWRSGSRWNMCSRIFTTFRMVMECRKDV